jgi:sulfonate transport system substrate-binding protein
VRGATPDLSKVTLRIGDQVGQHRSKLQAAGLLADVPYKIEWSAYPAAVHLHEALKAEAIDIGAANDSPTVSAIAGGSKIAVVAAWSNGGKGTRLYVPKTSAVQSVAELKGKTISPTTRGSVAHFLVVGELRKAGLSESDVKLAFLNPVDAGAAFAAGDLDAWATWGIYGARIRSSLGARVLSNGEDVNSGLFVFSATRTALQDPGKIAAIADYADRIERSYRWTREAKAAHIAWYRTYAKQDEQTALAVYEDDAPYHRVTIDDAFAARIQKTFDTWTSIGVLNGKIDFRDYLYRDLVVGA